MMKTGMQAIEEYQSSLDYIFKSLDPYLPLVLDKIICDYLDVSAAKEIDVELTIIAFPNKTSKTASVSKRTQTFPANETIRDVIDAFRVIIPEIEREPVGELSIPDLYYISPASNVCTYDGIVPGIHVSMDLPLWYLLSLSNSNSGLMVNFVSSPSYIGSLDWKGLNEMSRWPAELDREKYSSLYSFMPSNETELNNRTKHTARGSWCCLDIV